MPRYRKFLIKNGKCETSFPVSKHFSAIFLSFIFLLLCQLIAAPAGKKSPWWTSSISNDMCRWRRQKSATFRSILVSHCEWINNYLKSYYVIVRTMWMDYCCSQRPCRSHTNDYRNCRRRHRIPPEGWMQSDFKNCKRKKTQAKYTWWNGNRHVCESNRIKTMTEFDFCAPTPGRQTATRPMWYLTRATLIFMCRNCLATSSISYAAPIKIDKLLNSLHKLDMQISAASCPYSDEIDRERCSSV